MAEIIDINITNNARVVDQGAQIVKPLSPHLGSDGPAFNSESEAPAVDSRIEQDAVVVVDPMSRTVTDTTSVALSSNDPPASKATDTAASEAAVNLDHAAVKPNKSVNFTGAPATSESPTDPATKAKAKTNDPRLEDSEHIQSKNPIICNHDATDTSKATDTASETAARSDHTAIGITTGNCVQVVDLSTDPRSGELLQAPIRVNSNITGNAATLAASTVQVVEDQPDSPRRLNMGPLKDLKLELLDDTVQGQFGLYGPNSAIQVEVVDSGVKTSLKVYTGVHIAYASARLPTRQSLYLALGDCLGATVFMGAMYLNGKTKAERLLLLEIGEFNAWFRPQANTSSKEPSWSDWIAVDPFEFCEEHLVLNPHNPQERFYKDTEFKKLVDLIKVWTGHLASKKSNPAYAHIFRASMPPSGNGGSGTAAGAAAGNTRNDPPDDPTFVSCGGVTLRANPPKVNTGRDKHDIDASNIVNDKRKRGNKAAEAAATLAAANVARAEADALARSLAERERERDNTGSPSDNDSTPESDTCAQPKKKPKLKKPKIVDPSSNRKRGQTSAATGKPATNPTDITPADDSANSAALTANVAAPVQKSSDTATQNKSASGVGSTAISAMTPVTLAPTFQILMPPQAASASEPRPDRFKEGAQFAIDMIHQGEGIAERRQQSRIQEKRYDHVERLEADHSTRLTNQASQKQQSNLPEDGISANQSRVSMLEGSEIKDFVKAWEVLHELDTVDQVKDALAKLGAKKAYDLDDLEPDDLNTLAALLLKVPRKQFLRFLGMPNLNSLN
jgi:hypothetical protein